MDENGPDALGTAAASEALSALGDETRLSILEALFRAEEPQSFSALRDAVGVRDSGQFNYHLNKLVGPFVRKTDDGYELRYAGEQILGAVVSGVFTREEQVEPVAVAADCPLCAGSLVAAYEEETATVRCTDCDTTLTQFNVAPAIVDGFEREDVPLAFSRWIVTTIAKVRAGFCPRCTGPIRGSIGFPDDVADEDLPLGGTYRCERCDDHLSSTLGGLFLSTQPVAAFLLDHGIDLTTTPVWELLWLFEDHAELIAEDPPRAEVRITADDEVLVLTVADDLSIESWSRERA